MRTKGFLLGICLFLITWAVCTAYAEAPLLNEPGVKDLDTHLVTYPGDDTLEFDWDSLGIERLVWHLSNKEVFVWDGEKEVGEFKQTLVFEGPEGVHFGGFSIIHKGTTVRMLDD